MPDSDKSNPTMIDSTSDQRVDNNVMRHEYRLLQDWEKANVKKIKDMGLALMKEIASLGESRELSIAKTKLEESIMWAIKFITK